MVRARPLGTLSLQTAIVFGFLTILGVLLTACFAVVVVRGWQNYSRGQELVERHEAAVGAYIALGEHAAESYAFRPLGFLIVVDVGARAVVFPRAGRDRFQLQPLFRDIGSYEGLLAKSVDDVDTVILMKHVENAVSSYERIGGIPGATATGYRIDLELIFVDRRAPAIVWRRRFRGANPPKTGVPDGGRIYGENAEGLVAQYLQDVARAQDSDTVSKIEAYWTSLDYLQRRGDIGLEAMPFGNSVR